MDETISVEVGEDHLAAFRRSPKVAIAELIWNGLDADATKVSVEYELNDFDGVDAVTVRDDGTGMTPADAAFGFRNFGNSWKRTAAATRGGRAVHGKLGRGRYTAYAIGAHPVWTSVAHDGGVRRRLAVTGSASALRSVRVASEPDPVDDPAGTMVRIDQLTEQAQRELLHDSIWQELTTRFAPYLEQYPDVSITYRGNPLNVAGLRDRTVTVPIVLDDAGVEAALTIIEWNIKVERHLYLCDENGSTLADMPPGVHAPAYQFTAYLRWGGFRDLGHDILLAEMDSGAVGELVAAAKDRIRDYCSMCSLLLTGFDQDAQQYASRLRRPRGRFRREDNRHPIFLWGVCCHSSCYSPRGDNPPMRHRRTVHHRSKTILDPLAASRPQAGDPRPHLYGDAPQIQRTYADDRR